MATKTIAMGPTAILEYQSKLVRTGKCIPIGRLSRVSIGDEAGYVPPPNDPVIRKYGRMIDLRGNFLPIAQSLDRTMVLVTAPLIDNFGHISLPDLPDPEWKAEAWSEDEVTLEVERDPAKDRARMVPQRLEDRTSKKLTGSDVLVFQPVLRITYQIELDKKLQPTECRISFRPDPTGKCCAFLVDQKTGECHFFGGIPSYDGDARG